MQRGVPFLRRRRYLRGRPVHGTESASFCYSLKSPGTFQLKRCGLLLPSSWEAKDEVVGELSATRKLSFAATRMNSRRSEFRRPTDVQNPRFWGWFFGVDEL